MLLSVFSQVQVVVEHFVQTYSSAISVFSGVDEGKNALPQIFLALPLHV